MRTRFRLRLCKKREIYIVPLDLQIEILNRLPVKSLGRFVVVSKSWEKIIRSKNFITSFPLRPLNQPCRLLIALSNKDPKTSLGSFCFFSSSSLLSSSTSTSTSFLSRVQLTDSKHDNYHNDYRIYYVNGLLSIGRIICNPTTGKYITLPRLVKAPKFIGLPRQVKTPRIRLARRFFGYDPVDNQYKVLSMSPNRGHHYPWSNFRVFTLGTKPKSWRLIDCSIPHFPDSNGVCIDGFVYYIAHTGQKMMQLSVMRFDLKSEKFDIFAIVSEDIKAFWRNGHKNLINYHGKVAITIQPDSYSIALIDLFVFEAGKQDFKEMSFHKIPQQNLRIEGIIKDTSDFIFAPCYSREEAKVFRYDPKGPSFEKIKIEVDANHERYSEANYFVDYVVSVMLV